MLLRDFALTLVERCELLIRHFEGDLGRGGASDWAAYKKMVGKIAGLRKAQDEIKDQHKVMDEDYEEDEDGG